MSGQPWRYFKYPPRHQHKHLQSEYPDDHYNSPRHFPPGSLSARNSGPRPPHHLTAAASLDPGTPSALRTADFGRPLSSSPSQSAAPAASTAARPDGALPPKLYECPGVITCFQVGEMVPSNPLLSILIFQPRLECGLIQLELTGAGREKSVLCFFVSQQVCGNMNVQMRKGRVR